LKCQKAINAVFLSRSLISVGFKCGTLFLPESPEVCQSYFCSVWQSSFESHETLKCRNILPGVELAVTPEFQRGSLPLATDQALKEFIGAGRNLRDSEILESDDQNQTNQCSRG